MNRRFWAVVGLTLAAAVSAPLALSAAPAARVAAGGAHTCAVTSAGAVWCWGQNDYGQLGDNSGIAHSAPVAVVGLGTGVADVAAGERHTCALTVGGAVWCWGSNSYGQLGDGSGAYVQYAPVAVTGLSGIVSVSAGAGHTCAVTAAGTVWCWGGNDNGQLGDGTTTPRATPVAVTGLTGAVSVAAGGYHTCALTSGGAVSCWGANWQGALGDGTTTDRSTPVAVSGLASGVTAIAAGSYHGCALSAGAVGCWGHNFDGQLGDGTTTSRLTVVAVTGLGTDVASLAAGGSHTCAVTTTGAARCWGDNAYGQVGDGTSTDRLTPVAVSGLTSGIAGLAAGSGHTCAVTATGSIKAWGWNRAGQTGDGRVISHAVPATVTTIAGATGLSASRHTCSILAGGALSCWGYNDSGELGDNSDTDRSTPVAVVGLGSGVGTVAAGGNHTCTVSSAGAVQCWGWGGSVGNGQTSGEVRTPAAVTGLASGVAAVSTGWNHTCALTAAGAVWCWGLNYRGQLGDGTTTDRFTPVLVSGLGGTAVAISAGAYHTCALTSGGAVLCWGSNERGQLGDGSTVNRHAPVTVSGMDTGVIAVAGGGYHTCALKTGGGAWCWGEGGAGQLGDGAATLRPTPVAVTGLGSGVTSVSAGSSHTCAVDSAGGLWCWGRNLNGQVGDGTTNPRATPTSVIGLASGVVAVAAGYDHTCAIRSGGSISCWGDNQYGETGDGAPLMHPAAVPVVGFVPPASDLTRDGRSDIVWRHGTRGEIWLWPMNGAYRSSQNFVAAVGDTNWSIHGVADFTGDGRSDLFWRNDATGDLFLWTMNGTTITAQQYVGAVSLEYAVVGTADYNGDGMADLLWRHQATGALWMWQMKGASPASITHVADVPPAYAVAASGDVDGDGKADVVWRNASNGEVWLWLMNGPASTSQTYLGSVADAHFRVVGLADHDRDGKADILWWHETTGDMWLWRLKDGRFFGAPHVGTVGDTGYRIVGVGDYDGDGCADILWHHATRGEVWVWLMYGATALSQTWSSTVPDVGYQIVGPR